MTLPPAGNARLPPGASRQYPVMQAATAVCARSVLPAGALAATFGARDSGRYSATPGGASVGCGRGIIDWMTIGVGPSCGTSTLPSVCTVVTHPSARLTQTGSRRCAAFPFAKRLAASGSSHDPPAGAGPNTPRIDL
jgi:hypothetical protein